ncbi:hypothetical protein HAZT_HAZT001154 [Hyalella azteca]|uniref:Ig-like domain-containing protein n=1 Tax=Hyalella azteca TaxID=294128 RepID=A0A6A0HBR8_HYAAZ|nr:hypothetical protein HAZT_HAZT001154 [Hyalella azteca]
MNGAAERNISTTEPNASTTHSGDRKTSSNNTFIITSTATTAQAGEIVFLPCTIPPDMAKHAQVSWVRRQDWHILTSGLQTYTKEQRFAVHHTNATNEWTLAIKYVEVPDQGMYECQSAAPPQYIFWYHNSRMINYDKERGGISVTIEAEPDVRSRLTVTDARQSDSGNYTCDAANTEPASITVYITQGMSQSRAVGSSSRIAVIAYSLLWLPLAVASMRFTPALVTPGDTNTRWLSLLALTEAVKTISNSALDASRRPRAVREELRSPKVSKMKCSVTYLKFATFVTCLLNGKHLAALRDVMNSCRACSACKPGS